MITEQIKQLRELHSIRRTEERDLDVLKAVMAAMRGQELALMYATDLLSTDMRREVKYTLADVDRILERLQDLADQCQDRLWHLDKQVDELDGNVRIDV